PSRSFPVHVARLPPAPFNQNAGALESHLLLRCTRGAEHHALGKEVRVAEEKQNLLQLYRFCFLMLAAAAEAQEVFHATLREAAQLAAGSEAPRNRLWFFRNARWRCLEAGEQGLQAEAVDLKQDELAEAAPSQIGKHEPQQFAIWISGAREPQRNALALFYLD